MTKPRDSMTTLFVNLMGRPARYDAVCFLNKTCHQAVCDGGTDPDFREHVSRVFVAGFQKDDHVVEHRNEQVHNEDHPQVAFGIGFPVFASVEVGEHDDEQHRKGQASQMDGITGNVRSEEDIPQKHRDAHIDGAPVVELLCRNRTIEKVHPHDHDAGDVEQVEHQLGPSILQAEMPHSVEHDAHGDHRGNDGSQYIGNVRLVFKSYSPGHMFKLMDS